MASLPIVKKIAHRKHKKKLTNIESTSEDDEKSSQITKKSKHKRRLSFDDLEPLPIIRNRKALVCRQSTDTILIDDDEPKNEFMNHAFIIVCETDIGVVIILVDSFLINYRVIAYLEHAKIIRDVIIYFFNWSKFNKLSIIACESCKKN